MTFHLDLERQLRAILWGNHMPAAQMDPCMHVHVCACVCGMGSVLPQQEAWPKSPGMKMFMHHCHYLPQAGDTGQIKNHSSQIFCPFLLNQL